MLKKYAQSTNNFKNNSKTIALRNSFFELDNILTDACLIDNFHVPSATASNTGINLSRFSPPFPDLFSHKIVICGCTYEIGFFVPLERRSGHELLFGKILSIPIS